MADARRPSSGRLMQPPSAQLGVLLDRVAQAPHAFDFFHLLRQVDAASPERPMSSSRARLAIRGPPRSPSR